MLSSNPPTDPRQAGALPPLPTIAQRRRQHRRQNSTPNAFDAAKNMRNPGPPPTSTSTGGRPAGAGHRRGLSLDTRRQHVRQRSTASAMAMPPTAPPGDGAGQDFMTVGISTNTGLTDGSQQQQQQQQRQHHDVLREAQQQCGQARPGPQTFVFPMTGGQHGAHNSNGNNIANNDNITNSNNNNDNNTHNHTNNENYLVSPLGDPLTQGFDQCYDPNSNPFEQYLAVQKSRANFASAMAAANDMYGPASTLSTPTYVDFPEGTGHAQGWTSEGEATGTIRRTARRISNGIMDRVTKFETLADAPQRANTPPTQNENDCLSTRQMEAATSGVEKVEEQRPNRFSEGYDESMEETIRPGRASRQRGGPTVFDEMRQQAEQQAPQHQPIAPAPAPARSNTMPSSFDAMGMPQGGGGEFMDMSHFNPDFMKLRTGGYDDMEGALQAAGAGAGATAASASGPSPFDNLPGLRPHDSSSQPASPRRPPGGGGGGGHHRRTDSLASMASAASISSIVIEETRTDTGITVDDIATFIQGPDPVDNRWVCLFEACGKRFGRKENIKSHVQTHLNDRQYRCPTCSKCFVRQHDLKRHAKIHTGVKPYPCECGNSFARHDALTRHRQRGMCVGAFDGVVRKVVKRGRPRKHRPEAEAEDRADKALRSRRKNNLSISSVSSSMSGYSSASYASSVPTSPRSGYGMFGGAGAASFDLLDMSIDGSTINGVAPVLRRMGGGGGAAPNLAGYANSPESVHSYVSPEAIMETTGGTGGPGPAPALPPSQHPSSPAKSTTSHFAEPPELSQSSSPPPCRLFDIDPNTGGSGGAVGGDYAALGLTMPQQQHQSHLPAALMMGGAEPDEELMKAFTHDERLLHLDRDPSMFAVSKFDEEFAVSMMNAENDMFFGPN